MMIHGLTPEDELRATWAAIVELADGRPGDGVSAVRALHTAAETGLRGRELELRLAEQHDHGLGKRDPALPPSERRLEPDHGSIGLPPGALSPRALDRLLRGGR